MRTSILSRSAVAVVSLAIGSVALAATPATADTASGITRDQVLTAVNGVRAAQDTDSRFTARTSNALRAIAKAGCDVGTLSNNEYMYLQNAQVTQSGDDADGVLVTVYIQDYFNSSRYCTIGAFAPTAPGYVLSGTATVSGTYGVYNRETDDYDPTPFTQKSALSGDAFITPDVYADGTNYSGVLTATAEGNATKTTKVTTKTKVKDKKSTSEKKAAKVKYDKRIKAAKKSYAKALDKAGDSKSKKAAAKKEYKADRASARAKYKAATVGHKFVSKTKTISDVRPFSITTVVPDSGPIEPSRL